MKEDILNYLVFINCHVSWDTLYLFNKRHYGIKYCVN